MTDIGPRGPASLFWADPRRVERLREMAVQGLSSSMMASALGCSRNSIISKARRERIALTAPKTPGRPRVRSVAGPRPGAIKPTPRSSGFNNTNRRADAMNGMMARVRAGAPLRGEACQPLAEPAQPVSATAVTIFGLTDKTCRYPLFAGDEGIHQKLYCGGDVIGADGGSWDRMSAHLPYCGHHARMVYAPPPPRTRPVRRMEAAE